MKKLIIVIAVTMFAVSLLAGAVKNPAPTMDELKNEVYGLNQKVKMYKTELKKKDETIKKLTATIIKLATRNTQSAGYSVKRSSNSSYAQRQAQQQAYQKKNQKEQYQKLIAGNNARLKLYYTQKANYQKKYNIAMKQYKKAGQAIGKKKRKTESKIWDREVKVLKYKIQKIDKQINSLKQSTARYTAYAR